MPKKITANQLLGEIGEAAARLRFLSIGFQFDVRSRLEAGIDAIAEVMEQGHPLACMIAVQVKTTESGNYPSEDHQRFSYLLKSADLEYWRGSNLPVIIVLYRKSDESIYWHEVPRGFAEGERRLEFDKHCDNLDSNARDRLAALTIPKSGFGYYVPPLGGGEDALVNILPIKLPSEMFVTTTPHSGRKATSLLLESDEPARFDWVIQGESFWSFHDPRTSLCRQIVDTDEVEAIDTAYLAFHDDLDEQNKFSFLLKNSLRHQVQDDLNWHKQRKLLYFKAVNLNQSRTFRYEASKRKAESDVVSVTMSKKDEGRVDFVRHHAFVPRFERLENEWFLVINPTYFFTTNGFAPHSYPDALLAGKKRMDNSSSLRGQVIMWHRFLTQMDRQEGDLLAFMQRTASDSRLRFGEPPQVALQSRVPEDVWGAPKRKYDELVDQESLEL